MAQLLPKPWELRPHIGCGLMCWPVLFQWLMKFTKSPFNSLRPSVICPLFENEYFKKHHPSVAFKPGRFLTLYCVVTHLQYGTFISRWWFQTFFIFYPENWGRWTHFDDHIFQMKGKKPPTKTIHIAKPCKPRWIHGVFVFLFGKKGFLQESRRLYFTPKRSLASATEYQGSRSTWNLCSLG